MFDFFKRYTEEDILTKFVNQRDRILVVGPMGKYGQDPTLPILLEKIKNNNVTVIDIKGDVKHASAGIGDLFVTKETTKKISTNIKYVISDAKMPAFKGETFDIIIDRMTHEFIIMYTPGEYSQEHLDKLIFEYNRILKNNGKIIFFSAERRIHRKLIKALKMWGYNLIKGKLKTIRYLKIERRMYWHAHAYHYIVAIKS